MQCEDNSKLRIPLPEVCQTTDIGCVPITDGKPTCTPQPDELPFAFDPNTTTLWIFSCKTREWINFTKFTICQLDALNLDNITNICDILNIAVNYSGSGECQQGTITLGELADKILSCLKLETKIITIGEGDGNKIKISVDGLPLPPVYVQGENIWSKGGSGTESDPLKVATYDPICKWPTKSQAEVDGANVKHLGACLDGQMSRIPLPPKVCELPSINQNQVDATPNKELVACVNGEGVKVPFPLKPCEYSQLTPEQVISAADKDLIACVNGENVKIPVPYNLYESSPCTAPALSLDQAQSAGMNLSLLACNNGETVRVPLYGSGFFEHNSDWVYTCVPSVNDVPRGAPSVGSGPLRLDCCDNLHVWLCDEQRWQVVRDGIEGVSQLKINQELGDEYCQDFKMKGWFGDGPCYETRWFHLNQLVKMIEYCDRSDKECRAPWSTWEEHVQPMKQDGGRTLEFKNGMELVKWADGPGDTPVDISYGVSFAVWQANSNTWFRGNGSLKGDRDSGPNVGEKEIILKPGKGMCGAKFCVNVGIEMVETCSAVRAAALKKFGVTVVACVNEAPNLGWQAAMKTTSTAYHFMGKFCAKATRPQYANYIVDGPFTQGGNGKFRLTQSFRGNSQEPLVYYVKAGETKKLYLTTYVVIYDVGGSGFGGDDRPAATNIDLSSLDWDYIPAYHSATATIQMFEGLYLEKNGD